MKNKYKKKVINGTWFKINNNVKIKIKAKYDRIKDWRMDPKGYFLIDIDRKKKQLVVGYCKIITKNRSKINNMIAIINGKTAIEILNTLIKKKFISTLQHAGDMGIELCKAEIAMNSNLKYIQDKKLKI